MITKERVKLIKTKEMTYIADDGKEFKNERDCRKYEENLHREEKILEVEKFRIKELDDMLPLNTDSYCSELSNYAWYKLDNRADFLLLQEVCCEQLLDPDSYPDILCLEFTAGEDYKGDVYSYSMNNCKRITKEFWNKLGYEVIFNEQNKIVTNTGI